MISIDYGYIIVDQSDLLLHFTFASNRHDCWQKLFTAWKSFGFGKNFYIKRGYKCVRVEMRTEDYKR